MAWKVLKSETILENKFLKVHKDRCEKTDGSIVEDYYTVDRPDAAIIAAFTPEMHLVMIKQYRHPVRSLDYELPAGFIEPFETDTIQAAKRELLEETGHQCSSLEKMQETFSSAGFMSNHVHFFIGFNAKKISEQNLDDNEEIEAQILPWPEALKLLEQEKVKDLGSIACILLAKNYLEKHHVQ